MKSIVGIVCFNLISIIVAGQTEKLKSTAHGLDMMLRDIPKEQLIDEIRFEDGPDNKVDAIRLDHVGPNLFPLLISSKLPVPTDSLGILSFKLHKDTLDNFLWMIDHVNPKVYSRNLDFVLIRVTYRYEGRLAQYYVTNAIIATGFFMMIENKLIANKDNNALNKFYQFIARTGLVVGVKGKRTWKYLNASMQADQIQQHEDLVWDQNLPEDLRVFFNQEQIRNIYEINKGLNPVYLRGDFDGDKKTDYALAVFEIKTKKKGVLIYHPAIKKYFLVGAGKSIPNGWGDDYAYMDAWEVYDKKEVGKGVSNAEIPKLNGEAILIQKLESSSGIIYWDGKEYRWYPQGD